MADYELPEIEPRGLQVLLTIADANTTALIEAGIEAEQARKVGLQVADQVRNLHGGEQIYIPKGVALVLRERDWQIWEESTGRNHLVLAKKYDLTDRQIYNIIARCRIEHDRKHQLPLFE